MNMQVVKNSVVTLDYSVTDPDGVLVDAGQEPLVYLHGGYDDIFPLSEGAVRPSQGKTLAVMQVCGGSQSFNAVNQMRILGRWMRMFTIPNQSSVAKAWQEFDENGRMKPSSWYDRIVDVAEELFKITLLLKGQTSYLADRYSEQKESHQELSSPFN